MSTQAPVLPPGVHPGDPRASATDWTSPLPATPGPPGRRTKAPFAVGNGQAMGVFQRAAQTWDGGATKITTGTPVSVATRRKGRVAVTLWVPSKVVIATKVVTVTNGVLVAASAGEANLRKGVVLNKGDSLTIPSEGPVYIATLPTTTTGIVQVLETYNPSTIAPGT